MAEDDCQPAAVAQVYLHLVFPLPEAPSLTVFSISQEQEPVSVWEGRTALRFPLASHGISST
jgi:hypothetical protein